MQHARLGLDGLRSLGGTHGAAGTRRRGIGRAEGRGRRSLGVARHGRNGLGWRRGDDGGDGLGRDSRRDHLGAAQPGQGQGGGAGDQGGDGRESGAGAGSTHQGTCTSLTLAPR